MMRLTPAQGRAEGEARKLAGMDLAALKKQHDVKAAQLAMLTAGMNRADRSCSANDMTTDLAAEYGDGGKWVGAAVRSLARGRVIVKIGFDTSARPSRHGGDVKLWRVPDDSRAHLYMRALRLWLDRNPLPSTDDHGGTLFPFIIPTQKPSSTAATIELAKAER